MQLRQLQILLIRVSRQSLEDSRAYQQLRQGQESPFDLLTQDSKDSFELMGCDFVWPLKFCLGEIENVGRSASALPQALSGRIGSALNFFARRLPLLQYLS